MASQTRWSITLLLTLIAADLVLFGLSVGFHLGYLEHWYFALETDRGYSEFFQYIKSFWIATLFGIMFFAKRQLIFGVASVLFLYILLDDAMQIHENVGLLLVDQVGLQPALGLRARDFGELIVSATAGSVILTLGVLSYRIGNALARRVCIHLVIGCLLPPFSASRSTCSTS